MADWRLKGLALWPKADCLYLRYWAKARPSWRGRALLLDELLGPKNDKSPIRGDRAFVASAESGAKAGGTGLLWRLPAVRI